MKEISFLYDNSLTSKEEIRSLEIKLRREIENMNKASKLSYNNERGFINLVDDKNNLRKIKEVIKEKLRLKPEYLIVVGIGGSNLGTIAVQEAILGKLYNQLNPKIKVLYLDTVDSDCVNDIIRIIEPVLMDGNIIINVVSKSGTTTETIANFEVLVDLLKRYKKDYQKFIVVTTDKDSKLYRLALEEKFAVLEVPKRVGGRYSVFSAVGLFPLGLLGINIDNLLEGAAVMKEKCLTIRNNPAVISAALLYLNYKNNKIINDLFLFSNDLESIGKWYRQLIAESVGKESDLSNRKINVGITPTVSIGSTDLHSMAQLYLGGPYDKFITFVKVEDVKKVRLPNYKEYEMLVESIQGKYLNDIMNAIYEGVKLAFRKGKRAFAEILLPSKSEFSIGQLLQFKMIETIYLGYLFNINVFDQPNVEAYKIETKKMLERG